MLHREWRKCTLSAELILNPMTRGNNMPVVKRFDLNRENAIYKKRYYIVIIIKTITSLVVS